MQRLVHGWFVIASLVSLVSDLQENLVFCAQKQTLSLSLWSSCSRVAHRRVGFSGSRGFHSIGAPALVEASGTQGETAGWHQKGGPEGTTTHRGGWKMEILVYVWYFVLPLFYCFIVFVRMSCMMLILLLWFRHDFDWWWMWVIGEHCGFEGTTLFRMRKSFDYRIYMEQLRKIKGTLFLSHVRDLAKSRPTFGGVSLSRIPADSVISVLLLFFTQGRKQQDIAKSNFFLHLCGRWVSFVYEEMIQKTCITLTGASSQWRTRNDTLSECAQLPGANFGFLFEEDASKSTKWGFNMLAIHLWPAIYSKTAKQHVEKPTHFSENNKSTNQRTKPINRSRYSNLWVWLCFLQTFRPSRAIPLGPWSSTSKTASSAELNRTPEENLKKPSNLKRWIAEFPKALMLFTV